MPRAVEHNLASYHFLYMVADRGIAGSASPWNLLKIVFLTADHLGWIDLHLHPLSNGDHYSNFSAALSPWYNGAFPRAAGCVVLFVTLIEREFFRRAVLLLLTHFDLRAGRGRLQAALGPRGLGAPNRAADSAAP